MLFIILNIFYILKKSQFVNPATGQLYKEGEVIRNPVLANTLKRIALSHDPVQLFYNPNAANAKIIAEEFGQNGNKIFFNY
jgi:gamma-glutamyltranspeptidase